MQPSLCVLRYIPGPGFYKSINQCRIRKEPSMLSDICDASLYQTLVSKCGPASLANAHNISVILNTDGVVVYKSSNHSMWPVLLMINELPFSERYCSRYNQNHFFINGRRQPKNMILAGLWCGKVKPPMEIFLKPITDMLLTLECDGNCKFDLIT